MIFSKILPNVQAEILHEIALELNLNSTISHKLGETSRIVLVLEDKEELQALWSLFVERFYRILNKQL